MGRFDRFLPSTGTGPDTDHDPEAETASTTTDPKRTYEDESITLDHCDMIDALEPPYHSLRNAVIDLAADSEIVPDELLDQMIEGTLVEAIPRDRHGGPSTSRYGLPTSDVFELDVCWHIHEPTDSSRPPDLRGGPDPSHRGREIPPYALKALENGEITNFTLAEDALDGELELDFTIEALLTEDVLSSTTSDLALDPGTDPGSLGVPDLPDRSGAVADGGDGPYSDPGRFWITDHPSGDDEDDDDDDDDTDTSDWVFDEDTSVLTHDIEEFSIEISDEMREKLYDDGFGAIDDSTSFPDASVPSKRLTDAAKAALEVDKHVESSERDDADDDSDSGSGEDTGDGTPSLAESSTSRELSTTEQAALLTTFAARIGIKRLEINGIRVYRTEADDGGDRYVARTHSTELIDLHVDNLAADADGIADVLEEHDDWLAAYEVFRG